MTSAADASPPPDSGAARDEGEMQAAKSDRRRAAEWNPYLRRICFHHAPASRADEALSEEPAGEERHEDPHSTRRPADSGAPDGSSSEAPGDA
jgi:hypothetical protein